MNSTSNRPGGGEHRVFEELLSSHLDSLFRTAVRLCRGNVADAEDLLQDSLLRAFDAFSSLRERAAARSWLFRILVHTNLNRVRARSRRPEHVASDLSETAFEQALGDWQTLPSPLEDAHSAKLRDALVSALNDLGDDIRPVIVLVDIEGFRQREVAEMLQIPEGTVASRLFRARCALRIALSHLQHHSGQWGEA